MIHIVSFSFPPDNVPAAHRPYYLARYLEGTGEGVRVYSAASGSTSSAGPVGASQRAPARGNTRLKRRILAAVSSLLGGVVQVDKGLPWAIATLPRVVIGLLADRLRTGERPTVWATAPLASNIYLGAVASLLAGAHLHLDIRDAIDGINSRPAPRMTRWAMRRTKTLTTVTRTLAALIAKSGFCPPATVVFNGVSAESRLQGAGGVASETGWVEIAYAGALYGGERPYLATMELLSRVAKNLPSGLCGIRLSIAGREDLSSLRGKYDHDRFHVRLLGELDKPAALALASASEINLLLIGTSPSHRCGIPLKTFDLLGAGRPILYVGPGDADAVEFLGEFGPEAPFLVDVERRLDSATERLGVWLIRVRRSASRPTTEPSADSQSKKIAEILLESK